MTKDAEARVADRQQFLSGQFQIGGSTQNLYRFYKRGAPMIEQKIMFAVYKESKDTWYVFLFLEESGVETYSWVREETVGGLYDEVRGTVWDLYNDDHDYGSPAVTAAPFVPDEVSAVRTDAFNQYLFPMSSVPTQNVGVVEVGTAPAVNLKRYTVEDPEFDYVQEEVHMIFYKQQSGHKQWYIFLRAKCYKNNLPIETRFPWQRLQSTALVLFNTAGVIWTNAPGGNVQHTYNP